MGDSSKTLRRASVQIQDLYYLHASNANVSNFVSVKLSGSCNYRLWKAQMLCLLDSNNMCGIVDASFVLPRDYGSETMKQYDSLVKGWIFGSVSEDLLEDIFNLDLAKDVWEKLRSIYGPSETARCLPEGAKTEKKEKDANTNITEEGGNSIDIMVPAETETERSASRRWERYLNGSLYEYTVKGDWSKAESILKRQTQLVEEAISIDGSSILHLSVGIGHNDFLKNLLSYINDEQVLQLRETDGSTALHVAAIVGNKHAAELLVKKNSKLLHIKDGKGKEPLHKAYENMHLDTIGYLLKAVKDDAKTELQSSLAGSVHPEDDIGVNLLVNAISAKQFSLAVELVQNFPKFASTRDDVLVAIAKSFPSELDYWERLIYPCPGEILELLSEATRSTAHFFAWPAARLYEIILNSNQYDYTHYFMLIPKMLLTSLASAFLIIILLILFVCFLFQMLYWFVWEGARILAVPPVKHIENKTKEQREAYKVLRLVCNELDNMEYSSTHHPYYTQPILEAACHNAYDVVQYILYRSHEAIRSTDKNGYDIIQLAIINRSENIYNLIYHIGERKNVYRTCKDSSENNILHLAGKLAPLSVLNQRTGAALQLQRELQWFQEVKKLVFPTFITQENISKETPDTVFTREHENLVKEGEQWMKTTAESCSITAALIITIVFAAAITVPGGNNQEKGTPLFKDNTAFIIFAISDAISLFASSTALLVFLSILTARFSEKDFLVSLPRRLFIGLFSLLLSTTAMMVAFSATLFLVFCDKKPWMLAPICALAFIPIAFFVTLQFPLMVDLFSSTYLPIFGKQKRTLVGVLLELAYKRLSW